ncbi:MAG: polynucleotide adenylyltransferase, partial [Verrucomicrobiota bacterium]
FLRDTGWVSAFPELEALLGVDQDPEWHPEGDVWIHTGHALDALVAGGFWQAADPETRIVLSLATLCHDLGKPSCTRRENREGRERIVSPGHEPAGGPLTGTFLARFNTPPSMVARIVPLVTNHLAHLADPTPRSVRRLALRLAPATIEELSTVITADASGRPPRPGGEPEGVTRLKAAATTLALAAAAPRPLLLGRHLLERGLKPGPTFTPILSAAFEAQLDGAFGDVDGARDWLSLHLAETSNAPEIPPTNDPASHP